MNSMKRQKDRTLKDELPRPVGVQYATGNQWRNNSRKNEGMEPKQKQQLVVDMVGWHHRLNGHEFEQTPGHSEGHGSLACSSPWGCRKLDTT